MSTATTERRETIPASNDSRLTTFTIQPITYPVLKEEIARLCKESMAIIVTDVNDKANIELAHKTQMELVRIERVIEDKRVEMKAESLEYGRQVDSGAKELVAPIAAAKAHLKYQKEVVKRHEAKLAEEKAQREKEAEERRQAVTRERLAALKECGAVYMPDDVAHLDGTDFGCLLSAENDAKANRDEAERIRIAEQARIAEANRLESERLAKEKAEMERQKAESETRTKCMRARITMLAQQGHDHTLTDDELADMTPQDWAFLFEGVRQKKAERDADAKAEQERLDRQRKKQEQTQAKIDAERKAMIDDRMKRLAALSRHGSGVVPFTGEDIEHLTAVEFEAKIEGAIKNATEFDRRKQEKLDADAKAEAAAAEAELARLESLRPDHQKLLAVAASVEALAVPDVSEAANGARVDVINALRYAARDIRGTCEDLVSRK